MPIELSVVLVVGDRRDRAAGALRSLLSQSTVERMEVLLFDLGDVGDVGDRGELGDLGRGEPPRIPGDGHPALQRIPLPPDTLFSAAKAQGVRRAAAPVVAFFEEHCRAHPGWAEALIAAHRGPWAGVGAEVHNGNREVAISRRIEFLNYHPWMAPVDRGEHDMLPGHNSSFKRDVLLAYGDELQELLRAEIVLHTRLRRDGHRLLVEPAARFSHINESSLASAALGRFLWNRCYGCMRARTFRWSPARRALYVAATPLIPLYSLARIAFFLLRQRPDLAPVALAGAPAMWVLQMVSACGHSLGLLRGIGDAEARFSIYEMNEYRQHLESGPACPPSR